VLKNKALLGLCGLVAISAPAYAEHLTADAAAQSARDAAKDNRHDEAIEQFRRAMALAPDRRREWLLELADQLTWSGRLDDAVLLYRDAAVTGDARTERAARIGLGRALSWAGRHRESIAEYDLALAIDPDDHAVRLARAQVLSWWGRLGSSLAAYDAVLNDQPDDIAALRGRARVLSWRGRYRAAIADASRVLEMAPSDSEARVILAESLIWMGRPDRAELALRQHDSARPDDSRIAALLGELKRRARPETRIDWRNADQSDNLDISEISLDTRAPLAWGRGYVGVRLTRAVYRPDRSIVSKITVQRPAIYGGYRLSDTLELNGAIAIDSINTRGAAGDYSPVTFEAYATVRPIDRVRIDVGATRWTFDSEETLRTGLIATQIGGSADLQPDERTYLSGRISRTTYSDGNRRIWWQAEANHRLFDRPRIVAGYRYTAFDFTRPGQRGYYNPGGFESHELVLRGSGQITPTLRWDVRLIGGYETERPGRSRGTVNAGASLAQQLGADLEIEAAYDYSSSRTFSTGGFERRIARLTLRKRF
jgi:tetratricopeptide (TPR) repeat protein